MLSVSCPTCDATLGLSDEMAGQQVRCGGCQEVFVVDAPSPSRRPRSRDEDEDDRPRRRPARRDDDDEDDRDRPTRRRSRREDDYDDDEDDYDDRRRRKRRRKRKVAPGKPGLAVAAAILFLIWGGVGAILTVWAIVGLVWLLDVGAPATVILSSLVQVVLSGCFSAYLILSGLKILSGQAENLAGIGTAVISVIGFVMLLSIVRVALLAPVFAFAAALYLMLGVLIVMSGAIIGGIFCIVSAQKYEKWQRS